MDQFMINDIIGFHIETTNICTLKCPKCERTELISRFPSKWKNQNLDLKHLTNFLDVNLKGKILILCGNLGDPIYYPELFDLCLWAKEQEAIIHIDTNGSYRKKEWWQRLGEILKSEDCVTFSIDGLPSNFTQYRINGDWESIKIGIDVLSNADVQIVWKYIPFKFNQENIDEAKVLSQQLGFTDFKITLSDRWDINDPLKPDVNLLPGSVERRHSWMKGEKQQLLDPKCLKNNRMHYISAAGVYHPCCLLAHSNFYYKTFWYKMQQNFKISETTISEILQNKDVLNFYDLLLQHQGPDACNFNCSK
jgi:MoaA/NifB/PqqE/SkfB family radical SAM enzyme